MSCCQSSVRSPYRLLPHQARLKTPSALRLTQKLNLIGTERLRFAADYQTHLATCVDDGWAAPAGGYLVEISGKREPS